MPLKLQLTFFGELKAVEVWQMLPMLLVFLVFWCQVKRHEKTKIAPIDGIKASYSGRNACSRQKRYSKKALRPTL